MVHWSSRRTRIADVMHIMSNMSSAHMHYAPSRPTSARHTTVRCMAQEVLADDASAHACPAQAAMRSHKTPHKYGALTLATELKNVLADNLYKTTHAARPNGNTVRLTD